MWSMLIKPQVQNLPISEAKLLPQDPVKDHVRGGVKTQLPSAALPFVSSQYD